MTRADAHPPPDPWTQYFAAAAANRRCERRRIHRAALFALLVHALFFALRLPEARRAAPEAAPPIRFPLSEFRPRPQPAEPPVSVVSEPLEARPTIVVPGPPEVDIVHSAEPIPVATHVLPTVEPLDFLPVEAPPAPPSDRPVRYDTSIERPQRIHAPLPSYTPAARHVRRQGRVVLEAVIDTEGRVTEARILRGLGLGLDESALATVSTWRFEPARRDGRPLAVIYTLVIHFRID